MESACCKIVLDKATNTYHSGQTIFGTITLLKYNGKKIRGEFLQICVFVVVVCRKLYLLVQ